MAPARRAAAMALVTLQRSPTPSAASSSASNSEVSPGPAAPAGPSSRRARPGPRVRGTGHRGGEGLLRAVRGLRGRHCTTRLRSRTRVTVRQTVCEVVTPSEGDCGTLYAGVTPVWG